MKAWVVGGLGFWAWALAGRELFNLVDLEWAQSEAAVLYLLVYAAGVGWWLERRRSK